MHHNFYLKPKEKSKFRLLFGQVYNTFARWVYWKTNKKKYSRRKSSTPYIYSCTTHETPLYRKFKNVDMWMQENKVHNLEIACKKINGIIIRPGKTFSYWKLIGKPTKSKGYKKGMIFHNRKIKAGIGGGLCQLSNMIFWMALHSPLTITERYRHDYDIFPDANRKIPFGSGATCIYNYRDLQLTNNTSTPIQILVKVTDTHLVGEIVSLEKAPYTYEVYEKDHIIKHHSWGGYSRHNVLYRKVFENNVQINDEFLFENHALMMYKPILENKDKKAEEKKIDIPLEFDSSTLN